MAIDWKATRKCEKENCNELATHEMRRYVPFGGGCVQRVYVCSLDTFSGAWWQAHELPEYDD